MDTEKWFKKQLKKEINRIRAEIEKIEAEIQQRRKIKKQNINEITDIEQEDLVAKLIEKSETSEDNLETLECPECSSKNIKHLEFLSSENEYKCSNCGWTQKIEGTDNLLEAPENKTKKEELVGQQYEADVISSTQFGENQRHGQLLELENGETAYIETEELDTEELNEYWSSHRNEGKTHLEEKPRVFVPGARIKVEIVDFDGGDPVAEFIEYV